MGQRNDIANPSFSDWLDSSKPLPAHWHTSDQVYAQFGMQTNTVTPHLQGFDSTVGLKLSPERVNNRWYSAFITQKSPVTGTNHRLAWNMMGTAGPGDTVVVAISEYTRTPGGNHYIFADGGAVIYGFSHSGYNYYSIPIRRYTAFRGDSFIVTFRFSSPGGTVCLDFFQLDGLDATSTTEIGANEPLAVRYSMGQRTITVLGNPEGAKCSVYLPQENGSLHCYEAAKGTPLAICYPPRLGQAIVVENGERRTVRVQFAP